MTLTYKTLDADDKKAVEDALSDTTPATVDATLLGAWERDHYGHSVRLATCTDEDCQESHRQAMADIEAAITTANSA